MFEDNPQLHLSLSKEAYRLADIRWQGGGRSPAAHQQYLTEIARSHPNTAGLELPHPDNYKAGDEDFSYCAMVMSREDTANHIYRALVENHFQRSPTHQRARDLSLGFQVFTALALAMGVATYDKGNLPKIIAGTGAAAGIAGVLYSESMRRRIERRGE